jgi:6-phosphofructokinase 2
MQTGGILTLTLNPALDITTSVEQLRPQRKLRCSAPRYDAGGGGINVSRAIRELGGSSLAFVAAGGATGKHLLDILGASGIDAVVHECRGDTRFSLTVMEQSSGEHFRFVLPGPQQDEAHADALLQAVTSAIDQGAQFIVASGSLPPGVPIDFYGHVARHAKRAGAALILDTSGPALSAALKDHPYCVRINHHEARELIGGDDAIVAADALARRLIDEGTAEVAIITIADQGAIVATTQGVTRIRPPRVTVRSTVGAGDSFVAALTLGLARQWPVERAARYGVAAAAAAVTTEATELCRRTDTERYFAELTRAMA